MNNAYTMSATLESKYRTQAGMITFGFAGFIILLMLLLKWKLPVFEKMAYSPGIEVELNLPDEPEIPAKGGGGGGNPVQASGPAGISPMVPPSPQIIRPLPSSPRDAATMTFSIIALLMPIALIGYTALSVDRHTTFCTPPSIAAASTFSVPSTLVRTACIG